MKNNLVINVAANNDFHFYLKSGYPVAMTMRSNLVKEGKKEEAKHIFNYAQRLQQLYSTANKTENDGLVLYYTQEMKLVCNNINRVYAEA